jgi:hypothetical protein
MSHCRAVAETRLGDRRTPRPRNCQTAVPIPRLLRVHNIPLRPGSAIVSSTVEREQLHKPVLNSAPTSSGGARVFEDRNSPPQASDPLRRSAAVFRLARRSD